MSSPIPPTAVQLEAAWLGTTADDGLPNLLTGQGGTLDLVQAYMPRTPATNKRALYLCHATDIDQRTGHQQALLTHEFTAKIFYPISTSVTPAETAQQNLDLTVLAVIGRIRGLYNDHTHGGAFLSVAEGVMADDMDGRIRVRFEDPEHALASGAKFFRADITYTADDQERLA